MMDMMFKDVEIMMKIIAKRDAASFVLTNWNNYEFTNKKDFMMGAQSVKTINGGAYIVSP